jgi:hypothetical protein
LAIVYSKKLDHPGGRAKTASFPGRIVNKDWQAGLRVFGCGEMAYDPGDLKGEIVHFGEYGGAVTFLFRFISKIPPHGFAAPSFSKIRINSKNLNHLPER